MAWFFGFLRRLAQRLSAASAAQQRLRLVPWLARLALANALFALLIAAQNVPWRGIETARAQLYVLSALFTQFCGLALLLALALMPVLYWLRRHRLRLLAAWTVFSCGLIVIAVDSAIFQLYRFHINPMVVNLLFGGALLDNLGFSALMWANVALYVLVLLGVEAVIVLLCASAVIANSPHKPKLQGRAVIGGLLILFIGTQIAHALADVKNWVDVTSQNRYVPWYYPLTMAELFEKIGIPRAPRESNQFSGLVNGQESGNSLRYPLAPLQCAPAQNPSDPQHPRKPLNIVLLVIDSLRADQLNTDATPNISAFAKESMRYSYHFSTGNATRYGVFGLLYGLPGAYWTRMLEAERGSILFDALLAQDYQLFLYASRSLASPEFDRTAFSRVRNQLHDHWSGDGVAVDTQSSAALIHAIQNHAQTKGGQSNPQPFFAFILLDAPHAYAAPDDDAKLFAPVWAEVNYLALNNDSDPTPFFNRYRAAVHFNDRLIGNILATLKENHLLDNTVVLITGDHGQEFNERHNNIWGHNSDFSAWQTQTPLVIHWPNHAPATIDALTSHQDIVPTLLRHAIGCAQPTADYSTGADLFSPLPDGRSIQIESWGERALRTRQRIYVFDDYGVLTTHDADYRVVRESIPPAVLQQSLQEQSRFLGK